MKKRRTQTERSEATTRAILAAATKLFAKRGFREVALEDVVKRTGLTRGALYHHFKNKEQLFTAVVERVERELADRIVSSAVSATSPEQQLKAGYDAFLDSCLDPSVQRILLLDAPAVLGVERWRTVDADYGLGMLRQGLDAAMENGALERFPVEALSHVLLGAIAEAGLYVAQSSDPDAARKDVSTTLTALLGGLRRKNLSKPRGASR